MIDKSKVKETIDIIRPMLQRDGGDVELVEITDEGIVKVKLVGACGTCPMSTLTLKNGIEAKLKQEVSDVKAVEAV
jgi:Fe-S cluster biogenesis protein NfuA